MSPVRRSALISVFAAAFLIAVKLVVGIATNSLGFLSEAAHSGTDLAAALLTFFAVGVARRPADHGHPFGHGKAEHLSALAECVVLAAVSVVIAVAAVRRLTSDVAPEVHSAWWAFAVIGVVIAVDAGRMIVSRRTARLHGSAALESNALHFASDLAGTVAVLIGLILVGAGMPRADAIAALFVAVLVVVAAWRMARVNIDVLMDHAPLAAEATARRAIEALDPAITLRRLRMREAGGRHFADVVISLPPAAALAEGHAAADAVEEAICAELPDADVVVHVEPGALDDVDVRERVHAAALTVPGIREIHNVHVYQDAAKTTVSLHLKLPADGDLDGAHRTATAVELAILQACANIDHVTTHLEPLDVEVRDAASIADDATLLTQIREIVLDVTGSPAHDVRIAQTADGVVAFLDIGIDGATPLARAHVLSGVVRKQLRDRIDGLYDVVVHTEPTTPPDPAVSAED